MSGWRISSIPAVEAPSPEAVAETVEPVAEEAPPSDDPWIETSRCSTCNECTAINDRMFAYDENKQAYFKDLDAGTFREIVEAAEVCQVAVIHPGKPRNPNEPGLEELIERAKPFQ
jgi:ferredoxin